jgi:hypothetical protein
LDRGDAGNMTMSDEGVGSSKDKFSRLNAEINIFS